MPRPEDVVFPRQKERFDDRRKERQQRKLEDEFFDQSTLLTISRLITQGEFDAIDYPISTGKEGGVFRATGGDGFRAVKVYRIGNAIFRRLPLHVVDQLKREVGLGNHARMIYAWTRREHTILRRLATAEVRCPSPSGYLRNVLVMEFIGTEGVPAPKLQQAVVTDPEALYADLVEQIGRMVKKAHLVHGDLSPYNVLLREQSPVLIDVAQSIDWDHPQAHALLYRDVANFARYLVRRGVATSPEEFFRAVGGETLPGAS
jgi:RIO kinase 1